MGGGSGTQNFVHQKWPDKIFPTVNFVFSHDGPSGLGRGGASRGRDHLNAEGSRQQNRKRPRNDQHNPQCANYWAPLTRQRHHKEHQPQRPSERSNPTQHAKGRRVTVRGPGKELQPDGMSHRGDAPPPSSDGARPF